MAGSYHGVRLDPDAADRGGARAAGRRPAQRDTLYNILETVLSQLCMRAMVLDAPGAGRVRGRSSCATCRCPSRARGSAVRRCCANAVCRTDLHVVEGELPDPKLPLVPGHQIVGMVEAAGGGRRRARGRATASACHGWAARTARARTAARAGRTSATHPPSRATSATAATPSTRPRAPTSCFRCRTGTRTSRRRRCCARA